MLNYLSNSTINIILLSSLSGSTVGVALPYENVENLIPQSNIEVTVQNKFPNISNLLIDGDSNNYSLLSYVRYDNENNINAILQFSKRIIENSKDIDAEFVEIVNQNFWELF